MEWGEERGKEEKKKKDIWMEISRKMNRKSNLQPVRCTSCKVTSPETQLNHNDVQVETFSAQTFHSRKKKRKLLAEYRKRPWPRRGQTGTGRYSNPRLSAQQQIQFGQIKYWTRWSGLYEARVRGCSLPTPLLFDFHLTSLFQRSWLY